MIYPANFEEKIGFCEVRTLLKSFCLTPMGREEVNRLAWSTNANEINDWLSAIREMRTLTDIVGALPLPPEYDLRTPLNRLRPEGTHLTEEELLHLKLSIESTTTLVALANSMDEENAIQASYRYPALHSVAQHVITLPDMAGEIGRIIDKYGRVKDNASPSLFEIRTSLAREEKSVGRLLEHVLNSAKSAGIANKDATPALRDGRLVIPLPAGSKRRVEGVVHDGSATGKTVYVEPTEVVEANNRIRELKSEERREVIRILVTFADNIRPHVNTLLANSDFIGQMDFINAKVQLAKAFHATEPEVSTSPHMNWIDAVHPLLQRSLIKQGKNAVPLSITLTEEERILVISGPNAGGKSVCLKTVGLLQYMLQCGLSAPMAEGSKPGVFDTLMIDIGDEQSIDNDLSTYSSHLANMKHMMAHASPSSLLLIDEFGAGTEPGIGGAMAQAVLTRFCEKGTYAVVNTHYQNLKHFADTHIGVVNGAMLYDRHNMEPLFRLAIGRPGSSFAIDIARKTGIPEEVIQHATDLVGSEYVQSDKYLQDIVRDKRYWENKRKTIREQEKRLELLTRQYEEALKEAAAKEKEIVKAAKQQAEELLNESNRKIENTIREIKLAQAEKEETKRIREELSKFKEEVKNLSTGMDEEAFARKTAQIKARKERREKRKREKPLLEQQAAEYLRKRAAQAPQPTQAVPLSEGDTVRIKGLSSTGTLVALSGNSATLLMGGMQTKVKLDRIERVQTSPETTLDTLEKRRADATRVSTVTRQTIDDRRRNFSQDLDIRGMRGDEALNAVQYFIDDAILVGMARVRILHGKGNGILRQLIRQYLASVPNVTHYADEHVQFGGAGITVVDF